MATFTSDLPLVILAVAVREYFSRDRPKARHDFQSGVCTAVRRHMSWSPLVPSSTRALQLDSCRPVIDPRLDMTFKVECALLCGGTCPGVLWSRQARGPLQCSLTVAGRRYLPSSIHRGIHVFLPSERYTTASLSCAPLPVLSVPLLSVLP